ncbi:hypothetical protein KR093_011504 [Drosophila rubida]|uniref:Uncharacterized protein n=1 Tax=Drosophila rubida TaxID=30044 RepID=A0AAD4K6G8_9MUSC|nr:hypothetical protein KR093_011504 [Drosophila rubida]
MVLSNSTPNNNQKQHELVVNTAAMNSADLSELIQLNAEIEERRSRHARCGDVSEASGLLRATMTREELFEVSSVDDDRFLTALEHQNSYVASGRVPITDLDLSSIENLMKYFDEEVPVTPKKEATVTLASCSGKVASVIAKLAGEPAAVVPKPQKVDGSKLKISELKQKYEQQLSTPQAVRGSATATGAGRTGSMLPMKVKEMAQLFNSKFNQVLRRNEVSHYAELHNELSLSLSLSPEPVTKALPSQGNCLVAEDVFRELSVKDKVLLFNQFVSDIAAKHPRFNEHADGLKAQAKKQMARGEVVAEQQASVRHLAQELEAKCALHATAPQRKSSATPSPTPTPKLHVSTLTVVIKPSPERRLVPLPGQRRCGGRQGEPVAASSSSQKRNLSAIRSALPTEAYAPPKKIRRTRQERAGNDSHPFFQNEPLESLFYSWLSAENGVLFDITSVANKEQTIEITSCPPHDDELPAQVTASSLGDLSQKSAVERLLEEAIAKLELEHQTKEVQDVDTATTPTTPATPATPATPSTPVAATPTPRKMKRQAPPVPAPRPSLEQAPSSSSASSRKQSDAEESESGLSTLPKVTSDESQPETPTAPPAATDFDFAKPVRPPRKKKMRRTLTWKKENSIVEATANAVTSTDSDSDYKPTAAQPQPKKKPASQSGATVAAPATATATASPGAALPLPEQSYIELDKSLMRHVNSPRKIKSAYTLTVMSSPSPNADSDQSPSPSQTPRQSLEEQEEQQQQQLRDSSFVDQGFETCSNDASPLRRSSLGMANAKPTGFSTPVKGSRGASAAQQQLFSPIGQPDRSRRSSLAMQVIREDHPLDLAADADAAAAAEAPPTPTCSEREFFANAPTVEMSSSQLESLSPSSSPSKFWLSAGDFTVSLHVAHNPADRLRLLYEIFTQKSWETRELTFGIDGHKFGRAATEPKSLPERPPSVKGVSHYWFASGDLAVPFSGPHMAGEKVERLFQFLDAELSSNADLELRFGVDQFEFSSIPEFWNTSPKFSIESNYSMLVGLQTGHSNGLEGRSKYAWPNSQSHNSTGAIKTSDLDQTEFESDSFSNNSGRLSFSPDLFSQDYEAVPLDELFDKTLPLVRSPPATATATTTTGMSMPQMLHTLQQQQIRLKGVEQRIKNYELPAKLNEVTFKQCRSKPEYAQKLRAIDNIARSNGFRACSMEQLESFMQFLVEYADVCLGSCSEHINKIIDSLLDQRAVAV